LIYSAGLLQGLALVTFPAASTVFTNPRDYALSNAEYGALFVPQTVMAVAASLLGDRMARRWGAQRMLTLGLGADLLSMALLIASQFATGSHAAAFGLLLVATAMMGVGFGEVVPALKGFATALFADKADAAVLALNALLGLGTALAPVLVAVFVGLGFWWGLPVAAFGLVTAVVIWGRFVALPSGGAARPVDARHGRGFWLFAAFALVYGIVETINATWGILYMKGVLHAAAGLAALALTLFWATATAGRVLFASVEHWWPSRNVFRLLPWAIVVAFVATAWVPSSSPHLGAAAFAFAGLGCSALLPLAISLGTHEAGPGKVIASYQVGFGLAAFGMGPLHDQAGLSLRVLFGSGAALAIALAALSEMIVRGASPTSKSARPR
jgi:MFS family permease